MNYVRALIEFRIIDHFLPKINGDVEWNQCCFQSISDTECVWSGIYSFNLVGGITRARFTYVLTKINDDWKIKHHHSSLMVDDAQD